MDAENYIYHKEAITMDFYKRALELKDETVADRRYIHQNAETGLELPKTKAYVMDKLKEYGDLWKQRNKLAKEEAERENQEAYAKLQKNIEKANKTAYEKLDKLQAKYDKKLTKMK